VYGSILALVGGVQLDWIVPPSLRVCLPIALHLLKLDADHTTHTPLVRLARWTTRRPDQFIPENFGAIEAEFRILGFQNLPVGLPKQHRLRQYSTLNIRHLGQGNVGPVHPTHPTLEWRRVQGVLQYVALGAEDDRLMRNKFYIASVSTWSISKGTIYLVPVLSLP